MIFPLGALATATMLAIGLTACGGSDDDSNNAPENVRMTWFGITNWHYQVGDLGIMLDGAVGYPARNPNPEMVAKVHEALKLKGTVDVVLLGHLHGDHSVDTPEWAKQTQAQYYGSKAACEEAVAYGIPAAKCTALYGGEKVVLNEHVTMRVVRWVHSIGCGQLQNGGGIETFGYLFTAKTPAKTLTWYVTDSGAGGRDLTTDQVDRDGVNRGAPLTNLSNAVRDAGIGGFEVWQGGPESRVVNQARTVVPAFDVRYFMPHHYGARGGFNILNGLHYPYSEDEMPELKKLLAGANVPQIYSKNFFDAFVYDKDGVRQVDNAEVKLAMGLPASGIGPGVQGENPRAGEMECAGD
ncbi:hypothetical protein V4F39_09670 [Aquincola sp. MAHUQ-54]|uniref:MBL fold metallo-hydrolase n=1 Tax=Aquincola agrisoli TaxID=3119538 RepID=A0AAW9QEP6_9BURK